MRADGRACVSVWLRQSHKFNIEHKNEPLARKEFIKKFGHRIRDSPTTMDPDQIFRALDTDSNGGVEKEELKGFRTLCADSIYLELHERRRAPSHTYRPP